MTTQPQLHVHIFTFYFLATFSHCLISMNGKLVRSWWGIQPLALIDLFKLKKLLNIWLKPSIEIYGLRLSPSSTVVNHIG